MTATPPPHTATSPSTPPGTDGRAQPDAAQRAVDPAEAIPVLRERIDELDAQIAALVLARTQVSKRIQAARVHGGGTRIELGRERVVLQGYRDTLGPDGALLGDAVLRVCRGAR